MIQAAEILGNAVGVSSACRALGVPRSSVYRARRPKPATRPRPTPGRAGGAPPLGPGDGLRAPRVALREPAARVQVSACECRRGHVSGQIVIVSEESSLCFIFVNGADEMPEFKEVIHRAHSNSRIT